MINAVAEQLATKTKLCNSCGDRLPITAFRRKRKGSEVRRTECNDCRNLDSRVRTVKANRRTCSKHLSAINRAKDLGEAMALVRVMLSHFGGMSEFVKSLAKWESESPPGSVFRGRIHAAVLHMMVLTEPQRQLEEAKLDRQRETCSDEELEASIEQHMLQVIESNPTVAVSCAAKLGWVVIPPDGDA